MITVIEDLVSLDDWNSAVAMGERAVERAPGDPRAAAVLAEALVGRGRGTNRARARELVTAARAAYAAARRDDVWLDSLLNGLNRALEQRP